MTKSQNATNRANAVRRLIAGAILGVAPLLIAVDAAGTAHADTTVSTPDPSFHAPVHHPAFPSQAGLPATGTPGRHHHQHHSG